MKRSKSYWKLEKFAQVCLHEMRIGWLKISFDFMELLLLAIAVNFVELDSTLLLESLWCYAQNTQNRKKSIKYQQKAKRV